MKAKTLQLGSDFSLPYDAISETFAILAIRGAGKSNTAAVMAEAMFAAGLPFVVVDPVGAWYGLRSSQDGTGPGLAIPIFGGKRGDVPLEKTGGALIADLVVDRRLTCILDLSAFESEAAKKTFLLGFASRLYQRNEEPLHMFLEEADDYIPQRIIGGETKLVETQLLRAFENIVRRGRSRGLGMTLITQRSAVLNKNVLTQCATLIAMRAVSPQDRDAIKAWVRYHNEADDLVGTLHELATGEAWVWSPDFLKVVKRVKFFRRSTFDSGATPKMVKGSRPAATLASIDLGEIQARMSATIEKAKAEDPRELQAEIRRLKKELEGVKSANGKADRPDLEARISELSTLVCDLRDENNGLRKEVAGANLKIIGLRDRAEQILTNLRLALRSAEDWEESVKRLESVPVPEAKDFPSIAQAERRGRERATPRATAPAQPRDEASATSEASSSVTAPQKRILDVLASFAVLGLERCDRAMIAIFADQSPKSSGFANNLGALRSAGMIDYPDRGYVSLTPEGHQLAEHVDAPLSLGEYHKAWFARVSGPQRKMLDLLVLEYPGPIERNALAEQTDQSPRSSGYANNLGFLRNSLGLIDYPGTGLVAATARLFPEGLR